MIPNFDAMLNIFSKVPHHWKLIPIIDEAIRTIDPINGLTVADLQKYAKSRYNWSPLRLKAGIISAVRYGLDYGHLIKCDKYRYGLRRAEIDGGTLRCGSCGGKMRREQGSNMRKKKRSCRQRRKRRVVNK